MRMIAPTPAKHAAADEPPAVRVTGLHKRYGDVTALAATDLTVRPGEFFTLLGPSGSGKTTLLRLIAGFERPDGGRIELAGRDVTGVPPFARDVNTVFQDYALFPHMTIAENIEYGLKVRHVGKQARRDRVARALEMVQLGGLGERKPAQLSGGQRQRVALARAIVNEPQVLLLDEPLGALDLKLRQHMQRELLRIQREVGITFIYVTHDQEEALTMSDRIAVLNLGRIEQVGPPVEVYEQPKTAFVADFIGVSNLIQRDGRQITVRPEKITILADGDAGAGRRARRAGHGQGRDLRRRAHPLRGRARRRRRADGQPPQHRLVSRRRGREPVRRRTGARRLAGPAGLHDFRAGSRRGRRRGRGGLEHMSRFRQRAPRDRAHRVQQFVR